METEKLVQSLELNCEIRFCIVPPNAAFQESHARFTVQCPMAFAVNSGQTVKFFGLTTGRVEPLEQTLRGYTKGLFQLHTIRDRRSYDADPAWPWGSEEYAWQLLLQMRGTVYSYKEPDVEWRNKGTVYLRPDTEHKEIEQIFQYWQSNVVPLLKKLHHPQWTDEEYVSITKILS